MTLAEILARDLIEIADVSSALDLHPKRIRRACIAQKIAHKIGGRWFVRRDDFRDAMPLLWSAMIELAAGERATAATKSNTATRAKKTRTCGI